ncbi:DUF2920 family protein [Paenibacillus anseongense]|uniref:DUF2920 family protein n=1 Tax=Paenibacillus TaxID=44249 RepID=UPI002DB6F67D|nr:DUF2920 family protein [Paenibacillus anseongense]MEC0266530.1 DUF2920 family protein [Paenibacillus anseongense]
MLSNTFYVRPHPDVELGYRRSLVEYQLTFPEAGVNEETGLILFITPFGDTPSSEYQANKLRPYLANKSNCIVAGVHYWGVDNEIKSVRFDNAYFATLSSLYGIPWTDFLKNDGSLQDGCLEILAFHLKQRGIQHLFGHSSPYTLMSYHLKGEYQSFGFLPALDYLSVLGDILKKHTINRRRIIAYGSSYGGYIALLLGKFAPHTFSAIIDNSGFSRASVIDICTKDYMLGPVVYRHEGVTIQAIADEPWTLSDELDPNYFSDSCRAIRSLLEEAHRITSDTTYYIFHGDEDKVCPTSEKEQVVDILKKYNQVNFKKVTADDIDGRVFKDLSHGMKASLRGIFDLVQEAGGKLQKSEDLTDFDRSSVHTFVCGNKSYRFSYSNDYQIRAEILN